MKRSDFFKKTALAIAAIWTGSEILAKTTEKEGVGMNKPHDFLVNVPALAILPILAAITHTRDIDFVEKVAEKQMEIYRRGDYSIQFSKFSKAFENRVNREVSHEKI